MTAERLCLGKNHRQSAPPDHPLFTLLADIAAKNDLPIDIHREEIDKDSGLKDREWK